VGIKKEGRKKYTKKERRKKYLKKALTPNTCSAKIPRACYLIYD